MINMGNYESYDEAPDKPFWWGRKRQCGDQAPPNSKQSTSFVGSPSKKVNFESDQI